MRSAWMRKASVSDANVSQMHYARQGVVTEEIAFWLAREPTRITGMEEVDRGRMCIRPNINHPKLERWGDRHRGSRSCRCNATSGASPNASDLDEEVAKLRLAVKIMAPDTG